MNKSENYIKYLNYTGLIIGIILLLFSALSKIMHWPSQNLSLIANVVIAVFYLRILRSDPKKGLIILLKGISVLVFTLANILYHVYSPSYDSFYKALSFIGLFTWLMLWIYTYMTQGLVTKSRMGNYSSAVFSIGSVFLVVGIIFKLLHYPNATPLLLIGIIGVSTWVIISLFFSEVE